MRGADGVKIAVLRKGRACLKFIWAVAHAQRYLKRRRDILTFLGLDLESQLAFRVVLYGSGADIDNRKYITD